METKKNNKWLVLLTMALGAFLTYWTNSALSICMPTIRAEYGISAASASTISMVYFLALACFTLPFGKIGDSIGYNKLYITGAILATVFTGITPLVIGIKPEISLTLLIIMRALTGCSLAMCISVTQAILVSVFPPEERGKVLGLNSMLIAGTGMLGELCGGFFAKNWRIIFFLPIPFGVVCVILGIKLLKNFEGSRAKVDYPGAAAIILMLAFLTLLLKKVNVFPVANGWILGGLAAAFLIIFVIIEKKSRNPLMSLKLFKIKNFTIGYILMFGAYVTNTMANTTRAFFIEDVMHQSSNVSSIMAILCSILIALFATRFGALSDKIGTKKIVVTALALQTIAMALYGFSNGSTTVIAFGAIMIFYGLSCSMFFSPNVSACMGSVPPSDVGMASGMNSSVRSISNAIGASLYSLVISGRQAVYETSVQDAGLVYNYAQRDMLLGCAAVLGILFAAAFILLPKDTKSLKNLKKQGEQK